MPVAGASSWASTSSRARLRAGALAVRLAGDAAESLAVADTLAARLAAGAGEPLAEAGAVPTREEPAAVESADVKLADSSGAARLLLSVLPEAMTMQECRREEPIGDSGARGAMRRPSS